MSQVNADQREKTVSGVLIRSRTRIKPNKNIRKSGGNGQPIFNDPLYQYLDNQVYNKQQHNFGPWVEMEKKSREKMKRNRVERNLPTLTPIHQQTGSTVTYQQEIIQPEPFAQNVSPVFQRTTRVISLQELRGVSLQLRPNRPAEPPKFRREPSLSRQPFFMKSQAAFNIKIIKSNSQSNRKSNFNYNRCLVNDQQKIISSKLSFKGNSPYLKLQANQLNPQFQKRKANKILLNELKQHRINKLK